MKLDKIIKKNKISYYRISQLMDGTGSYCHKWKFKLKGKYPMTLEEFQKLIKELNNEFFLGIHLSEIDFEIKDIYVKN